MTAERIVVGAAGDDAAARATARKLRDAGHEVVFVGGQQTPAQLARAAIAEDASRLVVDGDAACIDGVRAMFATLEMGDIMVVRRCDAIDAT